MLHQRVTFLSFAAEAGYDHFSAVNPYTRGGSRDHIRIAGATEPPPQIDGNTDAVSHGDAAGEVHIPIRKARICGEYLLGSPEENLDSFPRDPLNFRTP
jgi:hypothetical protein